ncbi:MAG TPA: GTP-binding protein, partial [Candidatus Wallbacteria bacterium]|nr:GTP-binding protein [Candidatus Wallbacteria bacterium]
MGFIIAMAGHVDHGKSSIIKALTGITTARYKEEIEREITIDIGFAHLDIEGAGKVSIIDVPGHEDFVHNMLAGIFDIKLALLVIAASEGIMPQTIEHFEILKLCGTPQLLVILNKSDLVSEYDLEFRRMEIEDFLKGSRFENSPVIAFSAVTKRGAEDVR